LQALPLQLLVRLLSFLSAQDLAAAARSSTLLRSLSDEPTLWRRLFCARWGKPRGPQQLPPKTWKVRQGGCNSLTCLTCRTCRAHTPAAIAGHFCTQLEPQALQNPPA
jgi:hypothetical protein